MTASALSNHLALDVQSGFTSTETECNFLTVCVIAKITQISELSRLYSNQMSEIYIHLQYKCVLYVGKGDYDVMLSVITRPCLSISDFGYISILYFQISLKLTKISSTR